MSDKPFRVIDLFSGCGGMSLGFHWDKLFATTEPNPLLREQEGLGKSPFQSVLANDFNDAAIETYQANFDANGSHSLGGPIEDLLKEGEIRIPRADVVIGGPPCQGFSLLNRNRLEDERRELWWHFIETARLAEARVIVMENVPQLLGTPEFDRILERLRALGFNHMMAHVLCAANYGVPQVRHRAIIMASRVGPIALPVPTHLRGNRKTVHGDLFSSVALPPWRSVRDAIGDLHAPVGTDLRAGVGETYRLHFGRQPTDVSIERYKAVPPGGNRFDLQRNRYDLTPKCWINKKSGGTDLFGRLWWDRPSVTVRTEFFKPEKGRYLHPEENRPITHREAARIQSFPDRFSFRGSKVEIAKQIGNAVPPLMAFHIARRVAACLAGETTIGEMRATRAVFEGLGETVRECWDGKTLITT